MKKLLRGHELIARAEQLGVFIYADNAGVPLGENPMFGAIASESEIQARVMQAEKHRRDERLWIFALTSAIASVVSAIAAWVAIYARVINF